MGSMVRYGEPAGSAQVNQGDSNEISSGQVDWRKTDTDDRPYWAGVTKGRDGLLGRIETTLGSIS